MREAIEASKKKFSEFLLMFNETDLLSWEAFIQGPSDTPYANYIFLVKINLTS
jgi:ubiquitin-protein ligase